MACSNGLRDLRRDLRRDRLSRLYATPDRTAPWRAGRDSYFLTLLHRSASQQRLGDGWDGPHSFRCRCSAGTSHLVLRNAYFRDDRPRRDGHWAVWLLVDRDRRQLHRKTDQRDRGGSAFPHRVRRVSDVTTYGVAGNIEASEKNSIDRARLMRSCIRLAGLCP